MKRRATVPLPIFNKAKRPRQALLAHPNNLGAPGQQQSQVQQCTPQWKGNSFSAHDSRGYESNYGNNTQQKHGRMHTPPYQSKYPASTPHKNSSSYADQENMSQWQSSTTPHWKGSTPRSSGDLGRYDSNYGNNTQQKSQRQHSTTTQWNSFSTPTSGDLGRYDSNYGNNTQQKSQMYCNTSSQKGAFTPYKQQKLNTSFSNSTHQQMPTPTSGGRSQFGARVNTPNIERHTPSPMIATPATGHAREPTTSLAAKSGTSSQSSSPPKPRKSVRMLTATAEGMQHWSKYKHHMQMIFEVFGVLNSPVTLGSFNAKEFTVNTTDGLVKCLFWEMDRNLPQLVRGHMHRVVGVWDVQHQHMKCYSVRPLRPKEDKYIRQCVEASDRSMRELVTSLREM